MNMDRDKIIFKLIQASPMLAAIGEELSFTKAAERLNVDQSAVSHRAKSLEEALGNTLFDRTTRHLRLTEIGEILCHAAIETVANWDTALDKLEQSRSGDLIRLSMPSSLAMKWLIPSLPNAHALDLNISVEVNEETIDFRANGPDAAIRFGRGPYPGLHSSHLSHCWLQPVASSKYLAERTGDTSILAHPNNTFLADRRGENDETDFSWHHYLSNTEQPLSEFEPDLQFDRTDLMLQAAIGGMGIGLGRTLLVEKDVEAGYLNLLGTPVRMRSNYWLVCSPGFAETNRFERLREWLNGEIKTTTKKTAGNTGASPKE
jgi:LysR family transcriptional regulator, glycine cleavage system transcriptional activator